MAWNDISEEERAELYRRYKNHESIIALSEETGIYPPTLERNLRAWKQKQVEAAAVPSPAVEKVVKKPEHPDYADIFYLLKQRSWSIGELANHFDCAPAKIHHALDAMKLEGYQIFADSDRAYFNSVARPKQQVEFPRTLADEEGMDVVFATFSDPHAGSLYAQPTALNKFIQIATEEYGARHIFVPGDITTGVNGYRGQEYDLVPTLQGCGKNYSAVVEGEVWLADHYIPRITGVKYYLLSGNHEETIRLRHEQDIHWNLLHAVYEPDNAFGIQSPNGYDLGYSCIIRLRIKRAATSRVLYIYAHHGAGGGRKTGGKVNRLEDIALTFPSCDMYLMGHVHERHAWLRPALHVNDRTDRISQRFRAFGITGTFKKTYELDGMGYGEKAMFPATALGCVSFVVHPFPGDEGPIQIDAFNSTSGLPA